MAGRTGVPNGAVAEFECAVCLQPCMYPVKTPCGHIFCFLCVKGAAFQSGRCPMCRTGIPSQYFVRPELVSVEEQERRDQPVPSDDCAIPACSHSSVDSEAGFNWFYQGRNGWWQYDERTAADIERAFSRSEQKVELMVAGNLYIIDFRQMSQFRKNEPGKKRRIKRDRADVEKKGVAGLKLETRTTLAASNNPQTPSAHDSVIDLVGSSDES